MMMNFCRMNTATPGRWKSRTFRTIMLVYPVSLSLTALMIFVSLLCTHPSRRFAKKADA